jgi:toxin FitB
MYLLDTNVISELRKTKSGKVDDNVRGWAKKVSSAKLFLSAITILELETGVRLVERRDSKQGAMLRTWLTEKVLPAFSGKILPIDMLVAQRCASLHVPNRRPDRDALIAATALVHGLRIVTRNTADFQNTNVSLVNPWKRPLRADV